MGEDLCLLPHAAMENRGLFSGILVLLVKEFENRLGSLRTILLVFKRKTTEQAIWKCWQLPRKANWRRGRKQVMSFEFDYNAQQATTWQISSRVARAVGALEKNENVQERQREGKASYVFLSTSEKWAGFPQSNA